MIFFTLCLSLSLSILLVWWFPQVWPVWLIAFLPVPFLFFSWRWLHRHSADYLNAVKAERHESTSRELGRLASSLDELGLHRGIEQLDMLVEKHRDLLDVLGHRFAADELTYGRYAQASEKVYEAAYDNLREIEVSLISIRSIDPERLQKMLLNLSEDEAEASSIRQRLALYESQNDNIEMRLAENESALTALANTASALANTQTGRGALDQDAEAVIEELERLAQRTSGYAKKR